MNKKAKFYKKLVVAPHIDDDVLGCGGIIDRSTMVLYCGVDESDLPDRPARDIRVGEATRASELLGNAFRLLENKVNVYSLVPLIGQFEKCINEIRPTEIYLPHPSYNQDHRTVYEAAITALRPHDKNHFVKKAMVYEQPHVYLWDPAGTDFKPNYFCSIDIDRKINAYRLMKSQVRSFRSPEMIRSMAQLRGAQSNTEFAEAFEILRWIE